MNEYEKRIKETRMAEANRKDLMGFDGKIGCVVRNLGQPLISHGYSAFHDVNYEYDSDSIYENQSSSSYELSGTPEDICRQIPVSGVEDCIQPEGYGWMEDRPPMSIENIEEIGYYFNGLSRGMQIEIQYTEESSELLVLYKGTTVYRELAGDLEAYVPKPEWETMIDRLYSIARKLQIKRNKNEKETQKQQFANQKGSWMQQMKAKWGF